VQNIPRINDMIARDRAAQKEARALAEGARREKPVQSGGDQVVIDCEDY
jgi:hypothetical protein